MSSKCLSLGTSTNTTTQLFEDTTIKLNTIIKYLFHSNILVWKVIIGYSEVTTLDTKENEYQSKEDQSLSV